MLCTVELKSFKIMFQATSGINISIKAVCQELQWSYQ